MDKLNTNEWLLADIAEYFGLSYSRIRGAIRQFSIKPKRHIRNQPVFTDKHVRQIEKRNTKPGPTSRPRKRP